MKIKYLGPRDSVNVGGYGLHQKDQVKDYPDEAGEELLATSVKQLFEKVDEGGKGSGKKGKGEGE